MKKPRKLVWRLFFSYILIALGALLAAGWYFVHSLEVYFQDQVVSDLTGRARMFEIQIQPWLDPLDAAAIDRLCKQSGHASDTRFTVVLSSGEVVGDSWESPANMDNHANRPEVAGALSRGAEQSLRFSNTVQRNVLYVAIAMQGADLAPAVVRAAIPLSRLEEELLRTRNRFLGIGAVIGLLALGVTLAISRQFGSKVEEIQQGAARLAQGELAFRIPVPDSEELARIVEALNSMAVELESRMQTVISHRNRLEAVLSSMVEGVIAIDREERIMSVNQAAARWFDIDAEKVRGQSLPEAIRNINVQTFIARALKNKVPFETDIAVERSGERILNIRSVALYDIGPAPIGVLVVFSDVTQLRRLEKMRRDFVANVSHEIKTPLTAIKGFVETLCQGVDDPEQSARFLAIISKHANRLQSIVEDLLMLSRIEDEAMRGSLRPAASAVSDLLRNAEQTCRPLADEKRITIEVSCKAAIVAQADPVLLEQAILNLLENAIKYSEPGRTVRLAALQAENEIRISVQDQGIGIDKKHLPRLFERFYRVDKSRSRSVGGTGLGLAIVKHIAQAHGGCVTVESSPGEGSRFTIHLPDPAAAKKKEQDESHENKSRSHPKRPVM
jgi:two-component system, OmpR family, phosphate regulon sensor histidine kinase PhoR